MLILLLLLLTLAALMASCKGEGENILAQMKFQTPLQYKPTAAKVLTELDGTVFVDAFFHCVSVSRVNEDRSTTHLIYDYVAEKTVFTLTDPYDESGTGTKTKLYLTYVGTSEDPLMLACADTLDYRDVCLKTVLYRLDNGEMLAELTSPTDTYRDEYSMFADRKVTVIAPAGSPEANQFDNSSPYMYRLKTDHTPYRFYNTRGELLFESEFFYWTEHARSRECLLGHGKVLF